MSHDDDQAFPPTVETAVLPDLPKPGMVLDDRYQLVERIGDGATGIVFRATDSRLRRAVAIKLLRTELIDDARQRALFQREAETMANLRHPNVVAVHDLGGWDEQPYLVMPFHRGNNLEGWTRQRGGPPLHPEVAMGFIGQIAAGVSAMHQAGVVHGDITPNNVIVSDALEAILVDLGLSRTTGMHQEAEALSGTPGYLAPELIRQESVSPRLAPKGDVYSLTVTAYWLLTGHTPWPGNDLHQMLVSQVDGTIIPPRQRNCDLPEAFDEPLLGGLHRDPAHRPDVDVLRDQLLAAARSSTRKTAQFVVVVDDDPDLLLLMTTTARTVLEGAEVVGLTDPRAALSLIESRTPDLVLTDLQMPHVNGVELVALIRGKAATAKVPIIVVTGAGGASDWRLLDSLGADCLVVKPLRPGMLDDAIRRALKSDDA